MQRKQSVYFLEVCPYIFTFFGFSRGSGNPVMGLTSVKQYVGGPVQKLTPNQSVFTPSPVTWNGMLNLNNIYPRDAVLLKDFGHALLAWSIPPAKSSPRLQARSPLCLRQKVFSEFFELGGLSRSDCQFDLLGQK